MLLLTRADSRWIVVEFDCRSRYRAILHADIIHLKRADGNGIDALLHVEPDAQKCKERAMLVVFNQNPHVSVNTTLRVPLYYSGLDAVAAVSEEGGTPTTMKLGRDWSVQVPIVLPPVSFTWIVFE